MTHRRPGAAITTQGTGQGPGQDIISKLSFRLVRVLNTQHTHSLFSGFLSATVAARRVTRPARATLENCYGKEEIGPITTVEESFFQKQNIEIFLPWRHVESRAALAG